MVVLTVRIGEGVWGFNNGLSRSEKAKQSRSSGKAEQYELGIWVVQEAHTVADLGASFTEARQWMAALRTFLLRRYTYSNQQAAAWASYILRTK